MSVVKNEPASISFVYKNWRGETRRRTVKPAAIYYGLNEHHDDGPQWFLRGFDVEREDEPMRYFALKDIVGIDLNFPSSKQNEKGRIEWSDVIEVAESQIETFERPSKAVAQQLLRNLERRVNYWRCLWDTIAELTKKNLEENNE